MATDKVSLSLQHDLVEEARTRAGRRGLSAYVNDALRRQLQHDRLGKLLDELAAEAGPIPDHVMEKVRAEWPADRSRPARRKR